MLNGTSSGSSVAAARQFLSNQWQILVGRTSRCDILCTGPFGESGVKKQAAVYKRFDAPSYWFTFTRRAACNVTGPSNPDSSNDESFVKML
jgi:hypothetical protein